MAALKLRRAAAVRPVPLPAVGPRDGTGVGTTGSRRLCRPQAAGAAPRRAAARGGSVTGCLVKGEEEQAADITQYALSGLMG